MNSAFSTLFSAWFRNYFDILITINHFFRYCCKLCEHPVVLPRRHSYSTVGLSSEKNKTILSLLHEECNQNMVVNVQKDDCAMNMLVATHTFLRHLITDISGKMLIPTLKNLYFLILIWVFFSNNNNKTTPLPNSKRMVGKKIMKTSFHYIDIIHWLNIFTLNWLNW